MEEQTKREKKHYEIKEPPTSLDKHSINLTTHSTTLLIHDGSYRYTPNKMRASSILFPALCASVFAAPVYPDLNLKAAMPDDAMSDISQYFNMLATKTQEGRQMSQAPTCDMSAAKLPVACKFYPDNKTPSSLHTGT